VASDDGDVDLERAAMENLWTLVQNNEYVYSQIFQEYDIFPGS
jgi:hypothetical protein